MTKKKSKLRYSLIHVVTSNCWLDREHSLMRQRTTQFFMWWTCGNSKIKPFEMFHLAVIRKFDIWKFSRIRSASRRAQHGTTKKSSACSTSYSQAVTHPSTRLAQHCLTSVIGREPVHSVWYGRRQCTSPSPARPLLLLLLLLLLLHLPLYTSVIIPAKHPAPNQSVQNSIPHG